MKSFIKVINIIICHETGKTGKTTVRVDQKLKAK
jgi:hypothetical protein